MSLGICLENKKASPIPSFLSRLPGPTPPGPRAPFPFSHCSAGPVRSSAATATLPSTWLNDRRGPPVIPLLQQPSSSPSDAQRQSCNCHFPLPHVLPPRLGLSFGCARARASPGPAALILLFLSLPLSLKAHREPPQNSPESSRSAAPLPIKPSHLRLRFLPW